MKQHDLKKKPSGKMLDSHLLNLSTCAYLSGYIGKKIGL